MTIAVSSLFDICAVASPVDEVACASALDVVAMLAREVETGQLLTEGRSPLLTEAGDPILWRG